ncbi:MAG: uroporphyrinogen decarboxylase [Alphaproteobacteria bacterium]
MVRGENPEAVPFWFMRQAGRYLPEYRALRAQSNGFLDMAYTPSKACEVTLQPLRRFGMDAAIIFSDILVVPHALGRDLTFVPGVGPKLDPLETAGDIAALREREIGDVLNPIYDALSLTRETMNVEGFGDKDLIGFCGAPWTLACYMIEGGGSKDFFKVRRFAYAQEEAFQDLIDILVEASISYLCKKIGAGAQAVQIFDSWAGILDAPSFVKWSIEPTSRIIEQVRLSYPDVPIIGFPRGAGVNYARYVRETSVDVIGTDSLVDTAYAAKELQPLAAVQGNLDPACLLAGGDVMVQRVEQIFSDLKGQNRRFVFNLGHGIHKDTPIEHVELLVKMIRELGALR